MFRYSLSWYIFALTLLESIIKTHLTVHDSSHGFIGNNQRYFDEDLNVIHEEITSGLRSARINDVNLKLLLKFEPEYLDFHHKPLGVPHLAKVTLFNIDRNKSIDMTSISGSTVHFHSSFFEDKKIPPLGNTSFNVVFLGREEGYVESSLFIHTTEGHFKYNVKGASIYSPYRLRPIVGIKLPINASFSPLIYMHNPHTEPMQIVEVYSSGGDFHLELPTGELEGPKDMWEIPPLQTKAVIRVRFQAKSEQNHTAYVRIKVNSSDEILVVPLEVEVTPNGGLFDPQGSIDFGVGGSLDAPKTVDLCVYNPLKKAARIHGVSSFSSEAVRVNFENVRLMPAPKLGKSDCVNIGTATLDWKKAFESSDYSGKIVVKYRNGKSRAEIPYYLTVLEGGVSYDPLTTRYFINDNSEGLASRAFKAKNNFLSSVRIINYTLPEDAQKFFKIENFTPTILKPKQEMTIFTLKLKHGVKASDLKVNSNIFIKTNISEVVVPLLSYSGKLQTRLPFKSKDNSLDLGLIGFDSRKDVHFLIVNNNPVNVDIKQVKTSIPMTHAVMLGCGKGNHDVALLQVSFRNVTQCTTLKPGEYAIMRLSVQAFNSEGQIWGDITVETPYELLSLPVHFKVAPGKLEIGPDRLVFDQCFPGKICSHPLRVHSTFNDPMTIEDIVSLPPDKRLSSRHTSLIAARAAKVIGHLYLDPTVGCGNECYSGLQHDTTAQWLKTLSLSKSVSDFDLNLVNVFYNRYLNQTANGSRRWQNLTLRLDTSEVRGHLFKTRVKMSWPSLLVDHQHADNKSTYVFPLTQIGNVSYRNVTLRNPSSHNLIIQLVLDRDYPDVELMCEGLPSSFIPNLHDFGKISRGFFFDSIVEDNLQDFGEALGLEVHKNTFPILLEPNRNFTFTVGFKGEDTNQISSLLFIRNNLTIVEVLKLRAQAAHPQFKFGNRKPGSLQPLAFELTEKHLKDCERQFRNSAPNLTVKRSFTARNVGDVTIHINGFSINDFACEGYGFKVLNCAPFALHPNSTKKIDIAFTPDLTLSKISRNLILTTSLNFEVNYTLHATIPPYYLSLCSNLISRPQWEIYLSYLSIGAMFVLFFAVAFLALLDAEKLKKDALGALLAPVSLGAQPVLDLRLVGRQTRAEIRNNSSKTEDVSSSTTSRVTGEQKIDNSTAANKNHLEEPSDSGFKMPVKQEPALVPATGKSKAKKLILAKKSSNNGDVETAADCKKSVEVKTQPPQKSAKIVEVKKAIPQVVKTNNNLIINNNVTTVKTKTKIVNSVPAYEEETSSTTTESSSSNNDDNVDKEVAATLEKPQPVDQQIKPKSNVPANKKSPKCANEDHVEAKTLSPMNNHAKIERKRSGPKFETNNVPANGNRKNKLDSNEDKPAKSESKKGGKPGKEKKDKSQNKKSSDKNGSNRVEKRSSPPVTSSSSVWGENRATFSDVVARSDGVNIANTRPLTGAQTSKPTMYVEPYVQVPNELGPIGSRPTIDFWQDSLGGNGLEQSSNSFFSNAQDIAVDNSNTPFLLNDFVTGPSESDWAQGQGGLMNLLEASPENQMMPDPWNQNLMGSAVNSYWTSPYTPLAETLPIQQPQPQQQQQIGQQSGYLWGSSSVWQPWAPAEVAKTPTRTPPGFDAFHQRKRKESGSGPPQEVYNPFGSSTIWTQQQQPNPWNYQGQ